ncbi:putative cation/H+ exchanger, CPA1 family, na+/H+ exchanger NHX -type [Helianthus annuus]|uniref:Cation/H+ exchanger, CPA1 family, na+/H+ exchanger NHX -type n=1 Tax=Helianthus annuus TaxID=4232 RepID=A0A9K3JFF8_HELAN|nr:putative cation/H+ exchanger, CPA1 family, na+/H+ exchanger NHX -type [Helianthus annuus]
MTCTGVVILLANGGTSSHLLVFSEDIFFIYLLPPIIFNAGRWDVAVEGWWREVVAVGGCWWWEVEVVIVGEESERDEREGERICFIFYPISPLNIKLFNQ